MPKIEIRSKRFNITNIVDAKNKNKIKWFSEHPHRNNTRTIHRTQDMSFQIGGIYYVPMCYKIV